MSSAKQGVGIILEECLQDVGRVSSNYDFHIFQGVECLDIKGHVSGDRGCPLFH